MIKNKSIKAFTIIELLVVITVIAIIAAITILAYSSITDKARITSLVSDLTNNAKKLKSYQAQYGTYPTALNSSTNCPSAPTADSSYCLVQSGSNSIYSYSGASNTFTLKMTNNTSAYQITESTVATSTSLPNSFARVYGGSTDEQGYAVAATSDGGFVSAGLTNSYGAGGYDAFLMKYDTVGNLTWAKTWGGTNLDKALDVIQTSDGGYATVGESGVIGGAYLSKYDSSGNLSWTKSWGISGSHSGQAVKQTTDGGYIVTGYSGGLYLMLAKFDSTGSLSWYKTWGAGNEAGFDVIQTSDGGYAAVGQTNFGAGSSDAFLIKFDSSGNISWAKSWGDANGDFATRVAQTFDGGYAISGFTYNYSYGGFIAKFDSSGNISWSKSWPLGGFIAGATYTSDGGFVGFGQTSGGKISVLKLDSSGNLVWNNNWGGSGTSTGRDVAVSLDGGIGVLGYTTSYGAGGNDVVLLKYSSSGIMNGCSSTPCSSPAISLTSPSVTLGSPNYTLSSSSPAISNPVGTLSSFSPTVTTVVSP